MYGSVRMRRKIPKSAVGNDVVLAAVEMEKAAWKDVLKGRELIMKERCMQTDEEEEKV